MTPEEQEQMKVGVVAVRNALGEGVDIQSAKIEESLWYYYFDTDKTTAYLRSKTMNRPFKHVSDLMLEILSPPEKPTRKQNDSLKASKFDQALKDSTGKQPCTRSYFTLFATNSFKQLMGAPCAQLWA